ILRTSFIPTSDVTSCHEGASMKIRLRPERSKPARAKVLFPIRSFLQLEQLESRESPTDIANVIGNAALAASFGGLPAQESEPALALAPDEYSQAAQTSLLSDWPLLLDSTPTRSDSATVPQAEPQPEPRGITIAGPTIGFVQNFNAF